MSGKTDEGIYSQRRNANLYLPRKIFNTLFTALEYYVESEGRIGETFFSANAKILREKILTYGRPFKDGDGEKAAVYLYGYEAAILVKLLIYYIVLAEPPNKDYYPLLKTSRQKRAERRAAKSGEA
jgi:hypothetical protein